MGYKLNITIYYLKIRDKNNQYGPINAIYYQKIKKKKYHY